MICSDPVSEENNRETIRDAQIKDEPMRGGERDVMPDKSHSGRKPLFRQEISHYLIGFSILAKGWSKLGRFKNEPAFPPINPARKPESWIDINP